MTRTMGDATHDAVPILAAASFLDMVAGYATGSPDIRWTPADVALFTGRGIPVLMIDQGFTGSPVYSANVIDVETGAWPPSAVPGWMAHATAPRPTVYCNRSTLPAVLATGWRGDLWLAIPGWRPGDALPAAPGCTIVAVQDDFSNPNYDLSEVLDPAWPLAADLKQEDDMLIIWGASVPGTDQKAYLLSGGRISHIQGIADLRMLTVAGVPVAGGAGNGVSAAEEAQLLADFPPGNPAVTVTTPTPTLAIAGTLTPQ